MHLCMSLQLVATFSVIKNISNITLLASSKLVVSHDLFLFYFVLFAIFILHSRESELYRYTLDGKSALAWELPFLRFYGSPVFHIKAGRPVKCLAQGHNKRTCRLVLHNLP